MEDVDQAPKEQVTKIKLALSKAFDESLITYLLQSGKETQDHMLPWDCSNQRELLHRRMPWFLWQANAKLDSSSLLQPICYVLLVGMMIATPGTFTEETDMTAFPSRQRWQMLVSSAAGRSRDHHEWVEWNSQFLPPPTAYSCWGVSNSSGILLAVFVWQQSPHIPVGRSACSLLTTTHVNHNPSLSLVF